jgi:hypothetical protein
VRLLFPDVVIGASAFVREFDEAVKKLFCDAGWIDSLTESPSVRLRELAVSDASVSREGCRSEVADDG